VRLQKEHKIEEKNIDVIANLSPPHKPMFFGKFEITAPGQPSYNDIMYHGSVEKATEAFRKSETFGIPQGSPFGMFLGKFQVTMPGQPSLNDPKTVDQLSLAIPRKEVGVPQGAPTSCSLATMALRPLERRKDIDLLFYADDVIGFSKKQVEDISAELNDDTCGIEVKESKTRELKRDGVWLVEWFVFLGIKYYPPVKKDFINFPYFPKIVSQ